MATTEQQSKNLLDYAFQLLRHLIGEEPLDSFVIQTKGDTGSVVVPNTVCLKKVDPAFHSFKFYEQNIEISFAVN